MDQFVVSARKYRPATFASVIGQKHITSTLKNAIERGQLAHAYLFCGPRGVGKTTCARIFAKAINCMAPVGAEACNACESCLSFNENRSLNIHELDAASNNSVDDIRSLIEQVRIIPQSGRYSVFIIDEVHMLSTAAFNAFLKTLEEPPAHAIFILATTEKHKILPTILSRCQIYDFNRIRVEDAVEYLRYIAAREKIEADEESLNLIAQKADGGMRDALSMFDKAVSFCGRSLRYTEVAQTLNVLDYDTYFDITAQLAGGDYAGALVAFDGVLGRGFSGQTFMAGLNRHLRDLLVARTPATLRLLELTGTLMERYRAQAEACDVGFLFGAIGVLTELDAKIRQSSNQRLLVELGLMKIASLGQKKNNGIAFPSPTEIPLPELDPAAAAAATQTSAQEATPRGTAVRHVPTAEANPATQAGTGQAPIERSQTAPRSAPDDGQTARTTTQPAASVQPAPAPEVRSAGAASGPRPAAAGTARDAQATTAPAEPRAPLRSPIVSLAQLLGNDMPDEVVDAEEAPEQELLVDPLCAEKLTAQRAGILTLIRTMRPRFEAAFDTMSVAGNTIRITVPSESLAEEIGRNRTELLLRIAEAAGVQGAIRLEVSVSEQAVAARPYRLEDRLHYLSEKNPLLDKLRRQLDLEAE